MKAAFFLVNHSFEYSGQMHIADLLSRLKSFSETYDFVKNNKDLVYRNDSIYQVTLYPNLSLSDALNTDRWKGTLDKDAVTALRLIISKALSDDRSNEEVLGLLHQHSQDNIYGLLCLHRIEGVEKEYLVYNKEDWYHFHRHFLALYPKDEEDFYEECKKYFAGLFFHERIKTTLKQLEGGLKIFATTLVHHLTLLNDEFKKYYISNNRVQSLINFSSTFGIEVTPQGHAKDKPAMTFTFKTDDGKQEDVCCEPHMKLSQSDIPGDSHHYYNRIYFHEGKSHIAAGRILIGHIGKHIEF